MPWVVAQPRPESRSALVLEESGVLLDVTRLRAKEPACEGSKRRREALVEALSGFSQDDLPSSQARVVLPTLEQGDRERRMEA